MGDYSAPQYISITSDGPDSVSEEAGILRIAHIRKTNISAILGESVYYLWEICMSINVTLDAYNAPKYVGKTTHPISIAR